MQFERDGALASQHLQSLVDSGVICLETPAQADQIQPASIDLRLGSRAYRVRSSFLPGKDRTVADCLDDLAMHSVDLVDGAVLEKSCVYIVPLQESLNLPTNLVAAGNPKSSTGRIDVFTRLITDYGVEFEQVPAGYSGPLYAEIAPLTFSVLVRKGSRLSQLRVRSGVSSIDNESHFELQQSERLVDVNLTANQVKNGVPVSVDLVGDQQSGLVGFRAKRHSGVVDVDLPAAHPYIDFWEPLYARSKQLILDPGEFYILVSKEAVHVPFDFAAEMVPYDTLVGEFRVHYAGFFDPGFGAAAAGGKGARAVLEVRSFDVPFLLEHGQNVGRLVYERMLETPDRIYGQGVPSNYQAQGLKLSKHFIMG
ncbi:2'-deoxycytidine 5'-triphosphate deaminase [Arenicella xantha]|uniref:dCTP deaminase n=1 Tax=Arenicella xantha TaxID=644221 RepID=A0A395JPS4_9GAMM|nr:2'-deoxycytidine 5'-triphosphate deaminase [Arenicella xantha]RBP52645.1 dCTP deaminase [Arenicella xantha]